MAEKDLTAAYFEATGTKPPAGWSKSDWALVDPSIQRNLNDMMSAGLSLGYNLQELSKAFNDWGNYTPGNLTVDNARNLLTDYSSLTSGQRINIDDPLLRYGETAGNIYLSNNGPTGYMQLGSGSTISTAGGASLQGGSGWSNTGYPNPNTGTSSNVTAPDIEGYGSWSNTSSPWKIGQTPSTLPTGVVIPSPVTGPATPVTGSATPVTGPGTITYTAPDGTVFTDPNAYAAYMNAYWANKNAAAAAAAGAANAAQAAAAAAAAKRDASQSAWNVLKATFDQYGLGALADVVKGLIENGASEAEMLLELRKSKVYENRFSANKTRIASGLRALSEAEYIGLEDAYANLMRRYGLPAWYTQQSDYGKQSNLEQFIANDVSPAELEDRIQLAVNRVNNGPKEVIDTLKQFYPNVSNGDIYAYLLDPKKALPMLQRQVTSAEIGAEAVRNNLQTGLLRADELAGLGVNQAQARQGYQAIGSGLERGRALGELYNENYDQNTAEQEVFGMADANTASRKRRKIINREQATFGGSTGISGGAFEQNRAGGF